MKKFYILVITIGLLASCATKAHCDAYGNKAANLEKQEEDGTRGT